jgi:membrane-associated protein
MDLINTLIDFILHLDAKLAMIISQYGAWTYGILFFIIFMETGFVITPFLPGDSLLFAAGTVAAMEGNPLSLVVVIPLLVGAAFGGDNTNYFIGKMLGKTVYERNYRLIKREYLDRTHAFYERHGGKTIIIARFMPIIRTFAPFVAGVGTMTYIRFISFSIVGAVIWVASFSVAGYFFGNIPLVKNNFTIAIIIIIFISILPMIIAFIKKMMSRKT